MAELVDALDSKSSSGNRVWVRAPPWVLNFKLLMKEKSKSFVFYKRSFWLISIVFFLSLYPNVRNKFKTSDKLNHIEELYELVLQNYQNSLPEDSLIFFLREGLLENLDPFTQYISKEELKRINEDFSGDFYGIGVQFTIIRDTVMVVKVIKDGPSEKANIIPGDRIISVNSENFTGPEINNSVVMKKLRGKRGQKVKISILRKDNVLEKILYRGEIPLNSIESNYMIKDDIGYIKLEKFSSTTFYEFKNAIRDLKRIGAKKLILDLRNNGGGYLQQAVDVTNEFLDDNLEIVSTKGDFRKQKTYFSSHKGSFKKGELVVLINENSASASEILAGAIQDHDRGIIVGKKSFGKGLVGEQINLRDGGALRITVAKYFTPSGRCIQKPYNSFDTLNDVKEFRTKKGRIVFSDGGITPDILILEDTISDFESKFWSRNYNILYEKAFDFADEYRSDLLNNYQSFFRKNNENIWTEIISLVDDIETKRKINNYKKNLQTLFKNMVLNQILTTEDIIYHYNKDDEYINKALEIISK